MLSTRSWFERNSNIFNVWCIGILTIVISICQVVIAVYQVSSIEQKNRYDVAKTIPQIEVIRESSEQGDIVKVINSGGEIFEASGHIYTFFSMQANVKPTPKKKRIFVPQVFSRPLRYEGNEKDVVLISMAKKNFQEKDSLRKNFSKNMSNKAMPSSASYISFIEIDYRDIFGNEYKKYFRIINPGLPNRENQNVEQTINDLIHERKYEWLPNDIEPYEFAERWVKQEFSANKLSKADAKERAAS